ncbi:MAG: hypothetical protein ABIP56_09815 [Dokdonella sp.]
MSEVATPRAQQCDLGLKVELAYEKISTLEAILVGGTIAGTLDILFAISFASFNGVSPARLLQTIASGTSAFEGGMNAAALGLVLHFAMSYAWCALFLAVAKRVARLARHPLVSGPLFGIVVFVCMRLIVLPLSAFPYPINFKPLATVLDLLSHMLLFGIPIAIAAHRSVADRSDKSLRSKTVRE